MHQNTTVLLTRDVEATIDPAGDRVVLQKGEEPGDDVRVGAASAWAFMRL